MLTIDRLRLHLPPGFQHRAHGIALRLASELAELPLAAGDRRLDQLRLPPVPAAASFSDREVAGRVAAAIHRQLDSGGNR